MSDRSPGEDDPIVVVYRVVDAIELSYLEARGNFGSSPSRSGKYFALTLDGACAFASAPMNAGTIITTTTLPKTIVDDGVKFNDQGPNGAGVSVFFSQQHLADVYDTMSAPAIWKER
jgi:hypothetical protein